MFRFSEAHRSKATAIDSLLQIQEDRAASPRGRVGTREEKEGRSGGRGVRESVDQGLYCGFPQKAR